MFICILCIIRTPKIQVEKSEQNNKILYLWKKDFLYFQLPSPSYGDVCAYPVILFILFLCIIRTPKIQVEKSE